MASSRIFVLIAGLAVTAGATQSAMAQTKSEIQNMDRDNDGVITRAEWRGDLATFRALDVNRDGVLSGTEVWDTAQPRNWNNRFKTLDTNNDGVIARNEWHESTVAFRALDRNRDGEITRQEFREGVGGAVGTAGGTNNRFRDLDTNNDGVIERGEWQESTIAFRALDRNRDGEITREEFREVVGGGPVGTGGTNNRFRDLDNNNDGAIDRGEWPNSDLSFRALDHDNNNRITRDEFQDVVGTSGNTSDTTRRGPAYGRGYERGIIEGRAAGREDLERNQGFDLEGQRELETADSGYEPRFGSKLQYQAGYRDGFRLAYREVWKR